MKRFSMLLTALLLLGFIPKADALSDQCQTVLAMPPVTPHYTQRVLDRADAGLAYARAAESNTDFAVYFPHWALSIGTVWAAVIETKLRITEVERNLLSRSACLRFDQILIECKMEEVRDEMNAQLDRGSFMAIVRLESLLRFLNERYRHLTDGALDPRHVDSSWGRLYEFDDPTEVWCCPGGDSDPVCSRMSGQACTTGNGAMFYDMLACGSLCQPSAAIAPEEESLCPFSSDYAAAFPGGYGCDAETLIGPGNPRTNFPPLKDEYDALVVITRQVDEYQEAAREFLEIQQKLDSVFGQTPELPPPPPPRTHKVVYGCNAQQSPVPARELRGPFSVDKNQYQILSEFMNVRTDAAISRQFSDDLKLPHEFPEEKIGEREIRELDEGSILALIRASTRLLFQTWSGIQGRLEGGSFPIVVDPPLETENSLAALRQAVHRLSTLAADKDKGLRDFVLRYAWFLRRTCMDRPCSLSLDQIIKISLTDECFPYTNGMYLKDDAGNPRWKQCMDAAGIEL